MNKPEPFCIQPQDYFAVNVIRYWIGIAAIHGSYNRPNSKQVSKEKLDKAKAHMEAIRAWQEANPDKVKVPD